MGALLDLEVSQTRKPAEIEKKCHSGVTILWHADVRAEQHNRKSLRGWSQTIKTVHKNFFLSRSDHIDSTFSGFPRRGSPHPRAWFVTILWHADVRAEQYNRKILPGWSQTIKTVHKKNLHHDRVSNGVRASENRRPALEMTVLNDLDSISRLEGFW